MGWTLLRTRRWLKYRDFTNNGEQNKTPQTLSSLGTLVEQPSPEACSIRRLAFIQELSNGTHGDRDGPIVDVNIAIAIIEAIERGFERQRLANANYRKNAARQPGPPGSTQRGTHRYRKVVTNSPILRISEKTGREQLPAVS